MRVLFWSELFWPYIGGAEVFATKLLMALRERGHEIIVVTRQDSPDLPLEDRYQGIPVYRFPFWTSLTNSADLDHLLKTRRRITELKRAFSPDLVHIHGFGPTSVLFHVGAASTRPLPLLFTLINELSAYAAGHESLTRVLRSAEWVTSKAAEALAQARRLAPEITPRSSIIHNGIDTPALLPEPLPYEAPRLLCLGRLAIQKGFDLALTALASIADRFPLVRLVIAGDGQERPALERQVIEFGLKDRVKFLGWVSPDEVPALLNTATMVLMPSRWEGLPSVVLQASMMARPVVATPVGGLSEVVAHQQTGLLVPPEDPVRLAEAITFLLARPAVATQMGQAARHRMQGAFTWERCVDAYDTLYRKLAKKALHSQGSKGLAEQLQTD
jgi:glycosyltransferase involved in cell wall biosynthesis